MIPIQEVSDVELAFPARISHLMPTREQIPEEYWRGHTYWNTLVSRWFFYGLKEFPTPKAGLDGTKAWRHLRAIMGSFEPKHEHKEAAVAYLLSQWFEEGTAK